MKTPPTLLVGLKESIDLSALTWLWPWVGTFETRPFCRAGFTTGETIINYCAYWILVLDIIGSYWPCILTYFNHRPVPARLALALGWHRVQESPTLPEPVEVSRPSQPAAYGCRQQFSHFSKICMFDQEIWDDFEFILNLCLNTSQYISK